MPTDSIDISRDEFTLKPARGKKILNLLLAELYKNSDPEDMQSNILYISVLPSKSLYMKPPSS